ncbi:MAG: phosphate signaling complex protein PhoU [bacterium]|nr:phosphate signaling complex protein PhoU [bacterium]
MSPIEVEMQQLKSEIVAMWRMVSVQMKTAMVALATMDKEMSQKVSESEKKVNSLELRIDRDCENIFALFNPVANDLRLVLALLRINANLERIGDIAASVAKFVLRAEKFNYLELVAKTHTLEMFEEACDLLDDVLVSFETENAYISEGIFKRDRTLNEFNKSARGIIIEQIKKDPEKVESYLSLLSVIRKLERSGDHSKSIAEEIIFFIEAKVLKHAPKGTDNN